MNLIYRFRFLPLWLGAVAVATAIVAMTIVGGAARAVGPGPAGLTSTKFTSSEPGMSGQVQVVAAAFPMASHGVVLIQQCYPCSSQSGVFHSWVAVTDNAGGSWTVRRTILQADAGTEMFFADARDGWAEDSYVTHDGGLTWQKARIPAGLLPIESVSIAGGRVWALTEAKGPKDNTVVLTGAASGDRLVAAPAQQDAPGGSIVAGAATTAYVPNIFYRPPSTATDNGGHSWYNLARVCPPGHAAMNGRMGADGVDVLQDCRATRLLDGVAKINPQNHTEVISRSTDGGLRWHAYPNARLVSNPQIASASVAWATCDLVSVCRTTNGGVTWRQVWRPPARPAGSFPSALATNGPLDADEVATVSAATGTYLIVYATTDGGQRWRSTVVPLPAG